MGITGGSTRENRPNRRCRSGRLLGATCEIIEKNMGGRLLGYGRLIGIIRYVKIHIKQVSSYDPDVISRF